LGGEIIMGDEEEDNEMATQVPDKLYTLNEIQAEQILKTPLSVINERSITNDIHLTKEKRISNAKKILASRKWK
jgi:hypothetical protein